MIQKYYSDIIGMEMSLEEEKIWICNYEEAKKHLKVDKLWSAIEEQIHRKLDVYLEDSWLKYLLHLVKVDETSAYLMYEYVLI